MKYVKIYGEWLMECGTTRGFPAQPFLQEVEPDKWEATFFEGTHDLGPKWKITVEKLHD
jgi:hypothetical protein